MQYLDHVRSRLFPLSEQDQFESPYYDYLQAPLQPLMDNLESQTVRQADMPQTTLPFPQPDTHYSPAFF